MLKKLSPGDAQLRAAVLSRLMDKLDDHAHGMRKDKVAAMARGGDVGQETPLPPGELETQGGADLHQEPKEEKPAPRMAEGGEVESEDEQGLKGESPASEGSGDSSVAEILKEDGDPSDEPQGTETSPEELKRKLRMML